MSELPLENCECWICRYEWDSRCEFDQFSIGTEIV